MLFSPLHLQDARGAELNACMKSLINHFLFGGSTPIKFLILLKPTCNIFTIALLRCHGN